MLLLTKRWKAKKEKQNQKEVDVEVDCREKAKDFPITLTCKRAKLDSYTFLE